MKKTLLLLSLWFLGGLMAVAQFTSVTATITDSDGQTWNNGKWSATLYNPYPANSPSINGTPLTNSQLNLSGTMSGSGVLTATMADNSQVSPAGTYWQFVICPNASAQCSTASNAVSGGSQNLSTQLSAQLRQLRFAASPTSYGYLDAEVSPVPVPGGQYFNVTSSVSRQWTGAAWQNGGGGGGVSSFNTRTGAVTLTAPDVNAVGVITNNTSGTAANVSGTPSLPNGTTATTQSIGDSTTKLATDAFVLANGGSSGLTALTGAVTATGPGSSPGVITPTGVGAGSCTLCDTTLNAAGQATAKANGTSGDITTALGYTPAIAAAFPTSGLTSYYQYIETSGSTVIDYSGHGNNATITNAPTQTGIGYYFNSTSNSITWPTALNGTNSYYFLINIPPAVFGIWPGSNAFLLNTTDTTGTQGLRMFMAGLSPQVIGDNSPGIATYSLLNGSDNAGGDAFAQSADVFGGTHVLAWICPASGFAKLYLDTYLLTNTVQNSNCNNNQVSGNFLLGGGVYTIYDSVTYSTDTTSQESTIATILRQNGLSKGVPFFPVPYTNPNPQIFFAGDSITCGTTLTGGSSVCGIGTTASNAYPGLVISSSLLNNPYVSNNFGVPSAQVQQQIVTAPYYYAPLCNLANGSSIGSLFEGTNNFQSPNPVQTPAYVFGLQAAWVGIMNQAGCRTNLVAMISRTGTPSAGGTYDNQKNLLDAQTRAGWVAAKSNGFTDLGADPNLGCDGCYANTTYFAVDGIHPNPTGQAIIANAVACTINGLDGSSPANPNPVAVTASTYTMTCADGGLVANTAANNINITLNSALWQSGRPIQVCNNTTTGSHTLTLTAPSDFPFNNISGQTTMNVANHSCANFSANYNQNSTTPGDYWRTF